MKTWQYLDENDRNGGVPPTTLSKIITAININHEVDAEIVKQTFDASIARLCNAAVIQYESIPSQIRTWIDHGLDGVSADVWAAQILEDGELIALLSQIRKKVPAILMGVKYLDALTTIANQLADGQSPGKRSMEKWPEYFEPLKQDLRITFQEKVLDIAKQKNGNISPGFFTIFQPEAFKLNMLKDDDEVVKKLFIPLLMNRNLPGLLLISKLISENGNRLDKLGAKHNVAEFEERVQEALQQHKDDLSDTAVKQIAAQLNIAPKQS